MEAYSPFPVSERANMASAVEREPSDSLMIVFGNLDNFFDYKDEGMRFVMKMRYVMSML